MDSTNVYELPWLYKQGGDDGGCTICCFCVCLCASLKERRVRIVRRNEWKINVNKCVFMFLRLIVVLCSVNSFVAGAFFIFVLFCHGRNGTKCRGIALRRYDDMSIRQLLLYALVNGNDSPSMFELLMAFNKSLANEHGSYGIPESNWMN